MRKNLLWALAVASACFSQPALSIEAPAPDNDGNIINNITLFARTGYHYPKISHQALSELRAMLHKEAPTLNTSVIDKVVTSLKCANEYNVDRNTILTVIDYSLPSSEKRLWVFDLKANRLLYNTYVSHGIKSGELLSTYFSNTYDSKASSIGVYKTEKSYYGREGLSLRLSGLDRSFNDNASNRAVVMHGGWYVDEQFIKKYGRAGRSWGCPALPLTLYEPIINTIKNNSLMVVYYPSDAWFVKSKFLTCDIQPPVRQATSPDIPTLPNVQENELRDEILFADLNKNNRREENEPIAVMSADRYEQVFKTKAPLTRMLRRQIEQQEYIALSVNEFASLSREENKGNLNDVFFVIPLIVMSHGYYETKMHIVDMGKIQNISTNASTPDGKNSYRSYTVYFDKKAPVKLTASNRFIRWLGL
ncbi:murein L,D-transpeptidase catalytic domain family protein [Legionella sp. CNM-4043-24]|uniref:murein L,D-transpeptidase catalytic domain family protein n=1 Tax=Legionella sp. CNM-4043-24 TaxID=3421646 RepID=UPI00403AAD11